MNRQLSRKIANDENPLELANDLVTYGLISELDAQKVATKIEESIKAAAWTHAWADERTITYVQLWLKVALTHERRNRLKSCRFTNVSNGGAGQYLLRSNLYNIKISTFLEFIFFPMGKWFLKWSRSTQRIPSTPAPKLPRGILLTLCLFLLCFLHAGRASQNIWTQKQWSLEVKLSCKNLQMLTN